VYANLQDLKNILPYNVKIDDTNYGKPSPGNPITKRSNLTTQEAIYFIDYASREINGRLSTQYFTPLRRINSFETEILENVLPGENVRVRVWDSGNFSKGQTVRLQNKSLMESEIVEEVDPNDTRYVVLQKVMYSYDADESKICILKFPDPVTILCARLAVSYAFEQLFNAEQQPDVSHYGEEQRKLALNSMDSILSGTVTLFGQDKTGRRYVKGDLLDAYSNPTPDFQFGREKG